MYRYYWDNLICMFLNVFKEFIYNVLFTWAIFNNLSFCNIKCNAPSPSIQIPDNFISASEPEGAEKATSVQTHIVMEGLGLTGVFTCVSPLRSRTVQVPENTTTHTEAVREKNDDSFRSRSMSMILLSSLEQMTLAECATIRKQQPEEELLRTINDIRIYESRKGGGGGWGSFYLILSMMKRRKIALREM